MTLSTAEITAPQAELDAQGLANAFGEALRLRAHGRPVRACQLWAGVESSARRAGARHLAVQAAAERSLTLTWTGALSVAGVLCDRLIFELADLEAEHGHLSPPPIDRAVLEGWGGVWFSATGLIRLRAEQLRRAGDYAGALEALEEAGRSDDQRPEAALPLWGRVILSDALRLAGDVEGALEVADAAAERAADQRTHPWMGFHAQRATACALLALDRHDEALACFGKLAADPPRRHAGARIARDLGIGETLRRQGEPRAAEAHLRRARGAALRSGDVVCWIQAQLCLGELARGRGAEASAVAAIVSEVQHRLPLAEHPWLRLRTFVLGALSSSGAQAEQQLGRAEQELPRFQRRSGDLELEAELVERCRVALATGRRADPMTIDFL